MAKTQKKTAEEVPFKSYQINLDGAKFTYRTRRDRPIAVLVGITQSGATHVWRWTSSPKLVKRGMSFLKRSPDFVDAFIVDEIVDLSAEKAAVSLPQGSHKQTFVLVSASEFEAARAKKAKTAPKAKTVAKVYPTKKDAAKRLKKVANGYSYSA
jgi:hypothetical protein